MEKAIRKVDEVVNSLQRLERSVENLLYEIELRDDLIDLIEEDIKFHEAWLDRMSGSKQERMQAIVTAYRKVRGN